MALTCHTFTSHKGMAQTHRMGRSRSPLFSFIPTPQQHAATLVMEVDMPMMVAVQAQPLLHSAPPSWWQRAARRVTPAHLWPHASAVVVCMSFLAAQVPQVPPSVWVRPPYRWDQHMDCGSAGTTSLVQCWPWEGLRRAVDCVMSLL